MAKKNFKSKKVYITTPIYYINSQPHIGHAYTTVIADVLARYFKSKGKKVFFLTGTDEHGLKIEKAAQEKKLTPQELCDQNALVFQKTWEELDVSYDNFIRTTDPFHIKIVQKVILDLFKKGLIYKSFYEGFYCYGCEEYKTKTDLINEKCPIHNIKAEKIKEESYFFKLSFFEKIIRKKIGNDEIKIRPIERRNEILEFLNQGLQDISISRRNVKWGIPLPFDKNHTLYVWIDALLNYLTGIGWQGNPKKLPKFWPPDIQLMSKDILRMHSILWPALLLGLEIPLPKKLLIHGYFTIQGQKMSKTLGNVISPSEMIKQFGKDATRYLLISICPFGKDGDISWEKFQEKYNADLSNGLGNLVSRICALAEKLTEGKKVRVIIKDKKIKNLINNSWKKYTQAMDELSISKALETIFSLVKFADKYIVEKRIWEKSKNQIFYIYNLLILLDYIAKMISPFMPNISEKIFSQLGRKFNQKNSYFLVQKKEILFPKI